MKLKLIKFMSLHFIHISLFYIYIYFKNNSYDHSSEYEIV